MSPRKSRPRSVKTPMSRMTVDRQSSCLEQGKEESEEETEEDGG